MDFDTWRAFEIDAGPAGTFWEVFVDNDADSLVGVNSAPIETYP